jgi:diguanylate cyclase (GGDEF)-like protein/PAS domain S-box-containing protein
MNQNLPDGLAEILLNHTRDGVTVTDSENKIIYINPAFTAVTGYSFEEAFGKNPNILNSGCHDHSFYLNMWDNLLEHGTWEGEIWDKKKNGEIYLEYLRIKTIRDKNNRITHYVAIFTDINDIHLSEQKFNRIEFIDSLTDLPNREKSIRLIKNQIQRSSRHQELLAILIIDLDNFKSINQQFGKAIGDQYLTILAKRLLKIKRKYDLVGRLGSDSFILILTNINTVIEVENMCERVLRLIDSPIEIDSQRFHTSASIGLTIYPFDSADAETLVRHADQAMYRAKELGKNKFFMFDVEEDKKSQSRREIISRLTLALSKGELLLHYQPKVNLSSGQVVGVEALLRWNHPEKGLLLPGYFLPIIEDNDLIISVGVQVLRNALQQITDWQKQGLKIPVSVNIAARQLLHRDFSSHLKKILSEYPDVDNSLLELEILETAALQNTYHVQQVIEECNRHGIKFALDDFGTGYASLSYLRDIPAEFLKIDRSFVNSVLDSKDDLVLIEGIIGLATAFQRTVIAEGVETIEQSILLKRLGCDIIQGYGIARPMPAQQIIDWVNNFQLAPEMTMWSNVQWKLSDFPLLVAQYDHINWVNQIVDYVNNGKLNLSAEEVTDDHMCRFGHWYYGNANHQYQHLDEYRAIEPIHKDIHSIGLEIIQLMEKQKRDKARTRLGRLLTSRDNILHKLTQLQLHVLSQD